MWAFKVSLRIVLCLSQNLIQDALELTVRLSMTLNSDRFCIRLPSVGIAGVSRGAWFPMVLGIEPGVSCSMIDSLPAELYPSTLDPPASV